MIRAKYFLLAMAKLDASAMHDNTSLVVFFTKANGCVQQKPANNPGFFLNNIGNREHRNTHIENLSRISWTSCFSLYILGLF
jgi:hypothetical protein